MITQLDAFQALADPTRRSIVEALRNGERQVNDIVEKARIHRSGASRHLRILHESGFVSMRPDGRRRLDRLRPEHFRELDEWLTRYRDLWEGRLDRLGAAIEKLQASQKTPNTEQDT
jgi:DNA-binding transcriptional ArsR family regulator